MVVQVLCRQAWDDVGILFCRLGSVATENQHAESLLRRAGTDTAVSGMLGFASLQFLFVIFCDGLARYSGLRDPLRLSRRESPRNQSRLVVDGDDTGTCLGMLGSTPDHPWRTIGCHGSRIDDNGDGLPRPARPCPTVTSVRRCYDVSAMCSCLRLLGDEVADGLGKARATVFILAIRPIFGTVHEHPLQTCRGRCQSK